MKRELGIARCGLACCLCSENVKCNGCMSEDCPDKDWCVNRKCSMEKEIIACHACKDECKKGLLGKMDLPYLPKDMDLKCFWIAWRKMRKKG